MASDLPVKHTVQSQTVVITVPDSLIATGIGIIAFNLKRDQQHLRPVTITFGNGGFFADEITLVPGNPAIQRRARGIALSEFSRPDAEAFFSAADSMALKPYSKMPLSAPASSSMRRGDMITHTAIDSYPSSPGLRGATWARIMPISKRRSWQAGHWIG